MLTKRTAVVLGAARPGPQRGRHLDGRRGRPAPPPQPLRQGQGRRVRRRRPPARRPEPADQGLDQEQRSPQRHPVHRRRHGRLRDHRRPQLPRGRRRLLQGHRRPAADRPDDALQRQQGHREARLRPRLGGHRHRLGDRGEDLRQRGLGRPARARRTRPCSSWPSSPGSPPATSPPPRSRTPPPPYRSATSASASCYGPVVDATTLPGGGQGERRPRLDQRAAARHPPRRHPGWWLGDLRRDRHGRQVGGQDARAAGQGAWLQLHHRQERPRRRRERRPEQAAARPVLAGQHAGEVRAAARDDQAAPPARPRPASPSPPSARSRTSSR